jgi:hypothetical protein
VFAIHEAAAPLKRDLKFGEPTSSVEQATVHETLIVPGAVVTAIGKYVAGTHSIVADTQAKGYLRVHMGGDARRVSAFPGKAIGQFLGGLAIAAAANGALWLILRFPPR